MILAGDVGGTKVHLSLYDFTGGRLHPLRDEKFPAHQFSSLDEVVNKFPERRCEYAGHESGRDPGSLLWVAGSGARWKA